MRILHIILYLTICLSPTLAIYSKQGFNGQCPRQDEEICGINNTTYQNECFMQKAGSQKAYDGWCINGQNLNMPISAAAPVLQSPGMVTNSQNATTIPVASGGSQLIITKWWRNPDNGYLSPNDSYTGCPCNDSLLPVCGSNGLTYANMCRAECANIKAVKYGECGDYNYNWPGPKSCLCPFEIHTGNAVCGVNGRTYESKCVSDCVSTPQAGGGFCKNDCGCAHYFKPVCGRDGATYDNECKLDCKGIAKLHEGICAKSSVDTCFFCEGNVKRVCGSDNVTYENECYMKCRGADKMGDGSCKRNSDEPCVCPDVELPVCGLDNVTYKNACEMECKGMTKKANKACYLYERDINNCKNKCRDQDNNPVCGSNGRTFSSKCNADCGGANVIANGPCGAAKNNTHCVCSDEPLPVCGVDGRDYLNKCAIQCAGVAMAWEGPCTMNADQSGALYKTGQVSPGGNYVDINGNVAVPKVQQQYTAPVQAPVRPRAPAPAQSMAPSMNDIKQLIDMQLSQMSRAQSQVIVLPPVQKTPEPVNVVLQFVNPNGTKTDIDNDHVSTHKLTKSDFVQNSSSSISLKMDGQMSLKKLYAMISVQPGSFYKYFQGLIAKGVVNESSIMFKGLSLGKLLNYIENKFLNQGAHDVIVGNAH